jgi:hypothetical protein
MEVRKKNEKKIFLNYYIGAELGKLSPPECLIKTLYTLLSIISLLQTKIPIFTITTMKKILYILFIFFAGAILISQSACKKSKFLTKGGSFGFSTDTLAFDTVFTTQGSVTKSFLITNNNNDWIKVNRIRLGKGNASAFRMNVDGEPTKDISNIDIAPFDSLYVFVAVTIDPTAIDNPFIIDDSVVVTLNETTKSLPLIAYGQNAVYVYDSVLQGNIIWTKAKPIVIVNSALVDSTATLTIEAGTRIYMHANSKLFVKGTLIANGTVSDSIVFAGDRLDRDYFGGDIPGEWCGLHFLQKSKNNILNYCTIKNGGAPWKIYDPVAKEFGYLTGALIYAEPNDVGITTPKVVMNNCFIGLSIAYGIFAFNSNITATNCLFYACGSQNLAVLQGGTYNFTHCTFGNYGFKSYLRHDKYSVVAMKNYFLPNPDDISTMVGAPLVANFTNCIVDGTATESDEVFIDHVTNWGNTVSFNSCLLKQKTSLVGEATLDASTSALLNKATDFKEPNLNDFTLKTTSGAKGAGVASSILLDIKDKTRGNPPSVGCWE